MTHFIDTRKSADRATFSPVESKARQKRKSSVDWSAASEPCAAKRNTREGAEGTEATRALKLKKAQLIAAFCFEVRVIKPLILVETAEAVKAGLLLCLAADNSDGFPCEILAV